MVIDRIVKKNDTTVVIHLDNGEKLFISYEVLIKNGLRKGNEISEDRFAFLVSENRKYFVRQKALLFLSKRIHSKRELQNKLRRKNYEQTLISEVLDELENNGLINDQIFADQYTDEKLNRKRWGILKIRNELSKKGVSRQNVDKAIENHYNKIDEEGAAYSLAKKKLELLYKRENDHFKLRQKINSFLLSRGYSYEVISEVINRLFKTTENYE